MASRRRASGTAITPAPAITRCSCSTSLGTSNAALCVPATFTAPMDGTLCSSRSWRATKGKISRIYFRADAAFAMPEVYEFLSPRRLHRDEHEPPAERVVAFYNKRGTCEQWIKE